MALATNTLIIVSLLTRKIDLTSDLLIPYKVSPAISRGIIKSVVLLSSVNRPNISVLGENLSNIWQNVQKKVMVEKPRKNESIIQPNFFRNAKPIIPIG